MNVYTDMVTNISCITNLCIHVENTHTGKSFAVKHVLQHSKKLKDLSG